MLQLEDTEWMNGWQWFSLHKLITVRRSGGCDYFIRMQVKQDDERDPEANIKYGPA